MHYLKYLALSTLNQLGLGQVDQLQGIHDLAYRQLPKIANRFEFALTEQQGNHKTAKDEYVVIQDPETKDVRIEGNSKPAIIAGLYKYVSEFGNVSISFTHSTLKVLTDMPDICKEPYDCKLTGKAVVDHRYEFNTCTFGYTTPYFTFEDWEQLLDYSALSASTTLSLAWTGFEQIMIETLREFGFKNEALSSFLSAQPFLPWNRFGNIQGDWNVTQFDSQFDFDIPQLQLDLGKKIIGRMHDLGIEPILPAFVGFLPRQVKELYPDAKVSNSTTWNKFPVEYSNVTFLDPLDDLFGKIQDRFLQIQSKHFGSKAAKYYTLDQFNEVTPASSEPDYLKTLMKGAIKSLKKHDPDAIMVMQAWNFYDDPYWTAENVKNYLSGAEKGELLILDLFSDHKPLYPLNDGYHGHEFIYSSLHDFGSAMGLEGSVQFLTQNFTRDRQEYPGMTGVGITPEGLEGNQMAYDILFAQAWSEEPLDIPEYVKKFFTSRYGTGSKGIEVPQELIDIWQDLAQLVYLNDQTTGVYSVPRAMLEVRPALEGISDKPGIQPTKLFYDPKDLEPIWRRLAEWSVTPAGSALVRRQPHLHNDLVDITRQFLANNFLAQYRELVEYFNDSPESGRVRELGDKMLHTLDLLDKVLYTNSDFTLGKWLLAARSMATTKANRNMMEFQARNLITGWGPNFQNGDYSARSWAGVVGTFYKPRWDRFIDFLAQSDRCQENSLKRWSRKLGPSSKSNAKLDADFAAEIDEFEVNWQWGKWGSESGQSWHAKGDLIDVIESLLEEFS